MLEIRTARLAIIADKAMFNISRDFLINFHVF